MGLPLSEAAEVSEGKGGGLLQARVVGRGQKHREGGEWKEPEYWPRVCQGQRGSPVLRGGVATVREACRSKLGLREPQIQTLPVTAQAGKLGAWLLRCHGD